MKFKKKLSKNNIFNNNRFLRNKSGEGWAWVYGLAFLFALGILYTVFLYVFEGHLVPTILTVTNQTVTSASDRADIVAGISKYMTFFKMMPFVLFFVVILYMILTTIYKQSGGQYQY